MSCWPKLVLLVCCLLATMELWSSEDPSKIISTPDNPTRVFIGDNVSLVWKYYYPNHVTLGQVVFGIWKDVATLDPKLLAVDKSGIPVVAKGYESKVSWKGNLTSSLAVFVLHHVQSADGNKVFGISIDFGYRFNQLHDRVRLQVQTKPTADFPRITYVTIPPLLQMGQNVSLNCTATGLFPTNVTWYKGYKVLASGISEAEFTLNITDKDWGEFLCVAKNSAGECNKSTVLKVRPESPTILNTNKTVRSANWFLQWSAVFSEGQKVTLYTVWYRIVNVLKNNKTRVTLWSYNVTGFMYHKQLTDGTSYMFAVTAWNRWGESLLETDKMLNITTEFPDRTTKKMDKPTISIYTGSVSTEPGPSALPSDSNKKRDSVTGKTEVILYGVIAAALCIIFLTVVVNYFVRKKRNREKENNQRHSEMRRRTPCSFTSQDDITSEVTQEATDETGSVILAEASLSTSESSLTSEQPTTSKRNLQRQNNQPRARKCIGPKAFQPGINTITPGTASQELPSSFETFAPCRGSEMREHGQAIPMSVFKSVIPEEQNNITLKTSEGSAVIGTVNNGSVQQSNLDIRKFKVPDTFRQNEIITDGFQQQTYSDDDPQLVDNNNLAQAAAENTNSNCSCLRKAKTIFSNHPQVKPRVKILDKGKNKTLPCLQQLKHFKFTQKEQKNPLYEGEAVQHSASARPTGQPHQSITQTRTCNDQHGYQNERSAIIPYQNAVTNDGRVDASYVSVLSNTNWEVSRDHLSLFERIGGGSFGQVWKGAALDVAGAKGWSVVAVKMLNENSSESDLKDLSSELDLLKKLKPHPNVIQLLGCLTKDVIRYKGGREFRPPLVILEFVPHGDLLGYLKKGRGEKDDYYNLKSAEFPRKIPTQQLYRFASDIARGMEFISAHQLIHRDLAARNVLVGEGLRCKITDFGMARDLGKAEIYVRRSNGLMPVKWMAVESLTRQVFTTESDVWSYGVVLYEIFSLGGTPYDGMTGEEVFKYVASGRRLPRTSAISSELYNLMLQCWHEDPTKRPTFASIASWTEPLAHDH